jgi:hypothetical protein
MVRIRVGGAFFFLAALTLLGCKSENPNSPARVSGRVTYNGNPVTGGTLTFHSADGGKIPAAIGADGTYSAFDIPDGDMVVTVETETINPERKQPEYRGAPSGAAKMYGKKGAGMGVVAKGQQMGPMPEGTAPVGTYVKIPAKYNDPAKSDLKCTLKKGDQKQDFNLTD